jgi:NADH-quinone oxidoreductase subunit D
MRDVEEAIGIIRQCLKQMPREGSVRTKLPPNPKGPPGEAYRRVESGRGALGHYVVSDGTPKAYRHKISPPSLRNLSALPHLLRGPSLQICP